MAVTGMKGKNGPFEYCLLLKSFLVRIKDVASIKQSRKSKTGIENK